MSYFTRINTRKERNAVRQELREVRRKRMMVRKESFLRLLQERIKGCTKTKIYFVKRRRNSRRLKAWKRYDSGKNPSLPCKNENLRGEDVVLNILEPLEGALIVVSKVIFKCDEDSHLFSSRYSKLADLLIETPYNQRGEGFYKLTLYQDDFAYAHRLIEALAEDLGFRFSLEPSVEKTSSGSQNWTVVEGKYKLL